MGKYHMRKSVYSWVWNRFSLALGQWTDDCSMGLCIADSYLVCQDFNGSDQRVRFWNWSPSGGQSREKRDV